MIRPLLVTATTASFETDAKTPFFAPVPFTLYLDGQELGREERNIFTLTALLPESEHSLRAVYEDGTEEMLSFATLSETMAVSVRDFGALGDGVHDDTEAIRTAIACLPEGGRLTFPEGIYLSFPIALKSHMTLELQEGAVLLGSTEREKYPWIPGIVRDQATGEERAFGAFEGNEVSMYQSLIFAEYAEDITIVGPGAVDAKHKACDHELRQDIGEKGSQAPQDEEAHHACEPPFDEHGLDRRGETDLRTGAVLVQLLLGNLRGILLIGSGQILYGFRVQIIVIRRAHRLLFHLSFLFVLAACHE